MIAFANNSVAGGKSRLLQFSISTGGSSCARTACTIAWGVLLLVDVS